MKCPLSEIARYWDGKETQAILSDCLKEECAWWVEAADQCSITVAAKNLNAVIENLQQIDVSLSRAAHR